MFLCGFCCFTVYLSGKVFISPLILKPDFAGHSLLVGSYFASGLEIHQSMLS
jgi:hypothetical protein